MIYSPRRIASNLMALDGELISRPLIEVDSEGVITKVEQYEDVDRLHHTEFYSGILTPGFINTHCHLELSYLRGKIEAHKGFAYFARRIGEVRGEATMDEREAAMQRALNEMRREGIAGVGDIVNGDSSIICKYHSDIQFRNFGEVFGLNTKSTSDLNWIEDRGLGSITPHSIYSLNDAIFKEIASRNMETPLSIHFKESPSEEELFHKEGSLWEWYERVGFECDFLHYGSAATRIVESVPKNRSVVLVHNCCVTHDDIELILNHFTAPIYWVLCPRSNDYISQITPPAELLHSYGANICLGTDSLASNSSLSMIKEIDMLREIPLAQRLYWATTQGAKALGFDSLGSLKEGYAPGINVISGIDYRAMQLTASTKIEMIIPPSLHDRQPL